MNDIALYDKNTLTEEQERCLPLLAVDMPLTKIAKLEKIPLDRLRSWGEDAAFVLAVQSAKEQKQKVLQSHMDQAGILALQYAINVLSEPVGLGDVEGRRLQTNLAKTVLTILSSKKVDVKIEAMQPEKFDNIDPDSAKIVAAHSSAQPSYVVIDNVEILEDEPILHKETEMGVLNKDASRDKIQCHICGEWHTDFVMHIRTKHGIAPPRYRSLYQLDENISFFIEKTGDANANNA